MEIRAPFRFMFWERNGTFIKVCSCENKHTKRTAGRSARKAPRGAAAAARGRGPVPAEPPGHTRLRLSSSWGQPTLSPSPSRGVQLRPCPSRSLASPPCFPWLPRGSSVLSPCEGAAGQPCAAGGSAAGWPWAPAVSDPKNGNCLWGYTGRAAWGGNLRRTTQTMKSHI